MCFCLHLMANGHAAWVFSRVSRFVSAVVLSTEGFPTGFSWMTSLPVRTSGQGAPPATRPPPTIIRITHHCTIYMYVGHVPGPTMQLCLHHLTNRQAFRPPTNQISHLWHARTHTQRLYIVYDIVWLCWCMVSDALVSISYSHRYPKRPLVLFQHFYCIQCIQQHLTAFLEIVSRSKIAAMKVNFARTAGADYRNKSSVLIFFAPGPYPTLLLIMDVICKVTGVFWASWMLECISTLPPV